MRLKKIACGLFCFCVCFGATVWSSEILIRGTVYCLEDGHPQQRRAIQNECIIVFPQGYAQYATSVAVDGVFDLHVPYAAEFINSPLFLTFQSQNAAVHHETITIEPEKLQQLNGDFLYELNHSVRLNIDCARLAATNELCWQELQMVKNQIEQEKEPKMQNRLFKTGALALAGAVSSIGYWTPDDTPSLPDTSRIDTVGINRIKYADVELADIFAKRYLYNLGHQGGMASSYDPTNAPFLNASLLAFADSSHLSVAGEFSSSLYFSKLSGANALGRFRLGYGFIYLKQLQETAADMSTGARHQQAVSSNMMHAAVAGASPLTDKLSLGLAANLIKQHINIPTGVLSIFESPNRSSQRYEFETIAKDSLHVMLDVSATYVLNTSLQFGLSLNNLLGRQLLANDGRSTDTRSLGIGAHFNRQRLAAGLDMLLIENHDAVIQGNLTAGITEWLDFHTAFASPDNIIHLGATLTLSHFNIGYSYAQNKHYRNAHFIHLCTTY